MRDPYSILVAGVGGQGNLVCGRIIAKAAVMQGLRPVVGDTFGASRRGGSVLTHIRLGKQDWGPLIPRGEVDVLLGFEPLETLRASSKYAGARTVCLMSMMALAPTSVTDGNTGYPKMDSIKEALESLCKQVHLLETEPVLDRLGSRRVLNTYMIGTLSSLEGGPIKSKHLRSAISEILDSEKDLTAFDEGAVAIE
ncbi:MAG: 2-oxoacid:acceptor oxidoreductase family protein [Candidatus Thorarchaeota archaeon]